MAVVAKLPSNQSIKNSTAQAVCIRGSSPEHYDLNCHFVEHRRRQE